MKLVPGDDKYYRLMVNGKYVPPKKISVGERNVLGLCYFFAKMFQNKTESNKYASEYLALCAALKTASASDLVAQAQLLL